MLQFVSYYRQWLSSCFLFTKTKTLPVERFSAYLIANVLCLRFTPHNSLITHRLVVKVRFVFSVALWMSSSSLCFGCKFKRELINRRSFKKSAEHYSTVLSASQNPLLEVVSPNSISLKAPVVKVSPLKSSSDAVQCERPLNMTCRMTNFPDGATTSHFW